MIGGITKDHQPMFSDQQEIMLACKFHTTFKMLFTREN